LIRRILLREGRGKVGFSFVSFWIDAWTGGDAWIGLSGCKMDGSGELDGELLGPVTTSIPLALLGSSML